MPRGKTQSSQSSPARRVARGTGRTAATAVASAARSLSTPPSRRPGSNAPGRLRIVGGTWKRTPILVADREGLRPTPDRVRETLFNWLGFLRPDLADVRGLDLFAGTGALGFELASRGARHVLMVEKDPRLVAGLAALKKRLAAEQIEIRAGDALQAVRSLAPRSFDIVLLDPPYDSDLLAPALERTRPLLAEGGLIYAESATPIQDELAARLGLVIVRRARAGRVCFHLLRADGS